MSVQILVGEAQDIERALRLFEERLYQENGRPWYKRRYGYHETPGALRRKRRKQDALRGGKGPKPTYPAPLKSDKVAVYPPTHVCIGNEALWTRTGPTTSAGR